MKKVDVWWRIQNWKWNTTLHLKRGSFVLFPPRAIVKEQCMVATGINEAMVLWKTITGWFLAFAIPPRLHHSCCDTCCCPGNFMSALGTTTSSSAEAGVRDDNGLNEVDPIRTTVVSADMNHTLLEDWSSSLWWSLKLDVSHSLCSKELKRALFAKDVTNSKITQE